MIGGNFLKRTIFNLFFNVFLLCNDNPIQTFLGYHIGWVNFVTKVALKSLRNLSFTQNFTLTETPFWLWTWRGVDVEAIFEFDILLNWKFLTSMIRCKKGKNLLGSSSFLASAESEAEAPDTSGLDESSSFRNFDHLSSNTGLKSSGIREAWASSPPNIEAISDGSSILKTA